MFCMTSYFTENDGTDSTTVEWSAPSPPVPHANFEGPLEVYRAPYEYSIPGAKKDFSPQTVK